MIRILASAALSLAVAGAMAAPHGLTAEELVAFDRVSSPVLSPDGEQVVFSLRQADVAANKATSSLWAIGLDGKTPARRLLAPGSTAMAAQFSPDGQQLYFLSEPPRELRRLFRLSQAAMAQLAFRR